MNNIETLKRWLVALEDAASCVQKNYLPDQMGNDWDAEIEEMRQAIEQAQQAEPVAFASHGVVNWIADKQFQHEADLYTSPQRQWVGLTDEEIDTVWDSGVRAFHLLARELEAKLKEKNHD